MKEGLGGSAVRDEPILIVKLQVLEPELYRPPV